MMPPYMSPLLIQFTPDHTVHTCHYILSYSSHLPLYLDTSSYTGDHTVHTCHYILMHVHTLPPQRSVHGCCCGTRSSLCSALAPVWWSCGICSPHNTLLCLWCCLLSSVSAADSIERWRLRRRCKAELSRLRGLLYDLLPSRIADRMLHDSENPPFERSRAAVLQVHAVCCSILRWGMPLMHEIFSWTSWALRHYRLARLHYNLLMR